MKQLGVIAVSLVASLGLAACGGGGEETPASAGGASVGDSSATVAVKSVDGLGDVLVDSSGKALYAADVESGGKVMCVDACESFWKPLTLASGTPKAASSHVGKLAVVKRPDGSRQVTVDGRLLYTFADDSAGNIKGNGFEDDFGGQHFTWNAVLAGGKVASPSRGGSGGYDYGQGSSAY